MTITDKNVKNSGVGVNLDTMSDDEFKKYLNNENSGSPQGAAPITDAEILERVKAAAKKLFPDSDNPTEELLKGIENGNFGASEDKNAVSGNGRQKILDRWRRDCERLKKEVPDFDLNTAMKNSLFRNLVINGMSIDGAYYAVKYKDKDSEPNRRAIMQNASSRATRSGGGANDLISLDDRDFRKEIRKLMY